MQRVLAELDALLRRGESAALCTVVSTRGSVPRSVGTKMLVRLDGSLLGTVGGGQMESRVIDAARETLRSGQPQLLHYSLMDLKVGDPGICGGTMEIFVEPAEPLPTLLVIGGGHVGAALVRLGGWLGFRVVLTDDRAEFCNAQAVPGADEYLVLAAAALPAALTFHRNMYIVLPTRGMAVDLDYVPMLLAQPHAYFGVIGSKRRWATTVDALHERGISAAQLAGVRAPMGLELNAETPEEIAVSILAEIIMLRRGGTGAPMAAAVKPAAAGGSA
ncbi:dehydrogenase [Anaerolineae bacterium]|nr:uncharacterized protein YqeB [Chloroflexota bacterium]GBL36783.1 uncharacterized protein YqeB [Anaerolineaceae bacterium]GDX67934.1 dehydrogenase [Anaerolineae bacterium]